MVAHGTSLSGHVAPPRVAMGRVGDGQRVVLPRRGTRRDCGPDDVMKPPKNQPGCVVWWQLLKPPITAPVRIYCTNFVAGAPRFSDSPTTIFAVVLLH